jgi:hypothetical protein
MTQTDSATTTNSLLPKQVAWNNGASIDDYRKWRPTVGWAET